MSEKFNAKSTDNYHQKAIIRKITRNVPIVKGDSRIYEVKQYVTKNSKKFKEMDYIYVINKDKKLVGVFSLKDLFIFSDEKKASEVCKIKDLITVNPETHQKKAAHLAMKNGLKALPVVSKDNTFLGAIPHEIILSIIHREGREEILQMSGIHKSHADFDDILTIPILQAFKHRVLWLVMGLFGGILAAAIIGYFEKTLESNLVLASFIPLVVYMADAVGAQIEAFVIRDFALNEKLNYSRYFIKHFLLVLMIAVFIGVVFLPVGFLFSTGHHVSFVISIALFFAIISAVFTGLIIPYILIKLKQDPANASGPIATIIQDILSVIIYFVIASWLL
ncbi:magnesium transporter [Candidatus Pacearchaeota archaeon]|nr:magnesium transporter [Candidatus Pacearchaeota archaeon]